VASAVAAPTPTPAPTPAPVHHSTGRKMPTEMLHRMLAANLASDARMGSVEQAQAILSASTNGYSRDALNETTLERYTRQRLAAKAKAIDTHMPTAISASAASAATTSGVVRLSNRNR